MGNADEFFRSMGIPRHGEPAAAASGGELSRRGTRRVVGDRVAIADDLRELLRDAEGLKRQFAAGQSSAAQHHGQDSTGAVRVTADGDGRVTDIRIDSSWRQTVGATGLGAAVLEAVADASIRRLTAWGEAVADAPPRPGSAPEARPERTDGTPGTTPRQPALPDGPEARQTMHELHVFLDGVEAELDEFEQRVDQRVNQQVVGRGPTHMVTVTVTGAGEVTGVDIRRRFLDRTDEPGIARELRAAFNAAYDRVGTLSIAALLGDGQLAKLHALGNDPLELLRRLGLGPR